MKHFFNELISADNRKKIILLLLVVLASSATLQAQSIAVSGLVQDVMGEPLPGVNIMEKGTTNGTITDIDGNFSLSVNGSNAVLTVSFVGFINQEVKVDGRSSLVITLREGSQLIDEVVVIGYATRKKATVAAAVSSVNNQDLVRSTSTTAAGALVGKISGITARQKSGVPGSATTIEIRNMGTPLYVIDGIMKDEAAFNALNIYDIDNVSILKDGAAAIYGIKAANGVVLITTKTGKKGQKPQVNLNAYMGWQAWTKYPDLLNAYQWKWGNYMKAVNDGNLVGAEAIGNAKTDLEKWRTQYYNPATGEDYRGFNWKDGFVSNAAPQYYINTNISGGSEKTDYYVSIGHIDQDAVFKDYNYNRTNLQANFNMQLTDNFKIGFQTLGKIAQNVNPALPGTDDYAQMRSSIFNLIPTMRPYANENPDYLNFITPTHDAAHNMAAYTIDNAGKYQKTVRTIQTSMNLEYKTPLPGLTAKALLSYYYEDMNEDNNEKSWKEYTYDINKQEYILSYTKANTYRGKQRFDKEEMTGQFTLNYDKIFAENHHVTAVTGFEFYKEARKNLNVWQSPVENPFVELITTNANNKVDNTARTFTTASLIFRAGYSFRERYILDFAGRYDASWRFLKGNQWGFFPSISGAWRLSEEEFYQDSKMSEWISSIKLRASYGEMGDDMAVNFNGSYPDFAYMQGYTFGKGGAIITDNPLTNGKDVYPTGTTYNGIPQTALSWMKISMLNVGVDLGFLNNRLMLEADMFRRNRSGIPAKPTDVIYPYEAGFNAQSQNLNSDQVTGIDGLLKWRDKMNDLHYSVGVNVTLARQKTLNNYGEMFVNAWDKYRWAQTNRWSNVKNGAIWMWETIGVFQTQEEIDNYPVNIDGANNVNLRPGDLIFRDVNGDGIIDDHDKRPLGYAATDYDWDRSNANKQPLLSMGINLGFEYKGVDLATDFAGGFMNTFVGDWHVKYGIASDQTGYVYNVVNAWRHEDIFDLSSPWIKGKFPTVRSNNPSIRDWNDFYAKKINYLRLRNLVVGYTLPSKLTQKALVQKFRIYFEGTNLLCWDTLNDFGFDPEVSSVTGFDYPQHKVYTVGVNVTF
ncbi:TonB-dependent receptor [uncultured Proteiniphilum sp.]|uniref:SusC/RagA family TonB-linked outer membrane protein n=1 Tax=uncultured Proteiniphilum sp. TaxID=497637 RepID=UPI0026330C5B|nr:TonB-dependent receptor [uncultured Proteiniphilum sp.]